MRVWHFGVRNLNQEINVINHDAYHTHIHPKTFIKLHRISVRRGFGYGIADYTDFSDK